MELMSSSLSSLASCRGVLVLLLLTPSFTPPAHTIVFNTLAYLSSCRNDPTSTRIQWTPCRIRSIGWSRARSIDKSPARAGADPAGRSRPRRRSRAISPSPRGKTRSRSASRPCSCALPIHNSVVMNLATMNANVLHELQGIRRCSTCNS